MKAHKNCLGEEQGVAQSEIVCEMRTAETGYRCLSKIMQFINVSSNGRRV